MQVIIRRNGFPPETVRSARKMEIEGENMNAGWIDIWKVKAKTLFSISKPYTIVVSQTINGELKVVVTEDGYVDNRRPKIGRKK